MGLKREDLNAIFTALVKSLDLDPNEKEIDINKVQLTKSLADTMEFLHSLGISKEMIAKYLDNWEKAKDEEFRNRFNMPIQK